MYHGYQGKRRDTVKFIPCQDTYSDDAGAFGVFSVFYRCETAFIVIFRLNFDVSLGHGCDFRWLHGCKEYK